MTAATLALICRACGQDPEDCRCDLQAAPEPRTARETYTGPFSAKAVLVITKRLLFRRRMHVAIACAALREARVLDVLRERFAGQLDGDGLALVADAIAKQDADLADVHCALMTGVTPTPAPTLSTNQHPQTT